MGRLPFCQLTLARPSLRGRRPARPRPFDQPVLTRAALLDAAARASRRAMRESVRAIARQLAISEAAVQHHSPAKQGLVPR